MREAVELRRWEEWSAACPACECISHAAARLPRPRSTCPPQGPLEWLLDAVRSYPEPVKQRIQEELERAPQYPGLDLPAGGLCATKMTGTHVGTLAKLLAVALLVVELLDEQSGDLRVVHEALVLCLEWQWQRDLPYHTEASLAGLEARSRCLRFAPLEHLRPPRWPGAAPSRCSA